MKNKFTDDDKDKVVEFLNFVAQKAEFKISTSDIIKYYGLLSHMQKVILPKIDDNTLELIAIKEPEDK